MNRPSFPLLPDSWISLFRRGSSGRIAFGALALALVVSASTESRAFFHASAKSFERYVVSRGDRGVKRVALTFDDGPSQDFTPQILDILDRYNVKATFFLMGQHVERYPDLARRIVREGHDIGNHSFTHADLHKLRREQVRKEIVSTEEAIAAATGVRPVLFRAPYGNLNRVVVEEARAAGCSVIQWSLSPRDWMRPRDRKIARRVVESARNGTIVLLHDAGPRAAFENRINTVTALPSIIESLRAEGYELVTVSELISSDDNGTLAEARFVSVPG